MTMLIAALTSVGCSIITCVVMEAYYQRRATESVHDFDCPDH